MNAASHAITSLVIKKYFPDVPLMPLLISVQLMDLMWIALNLIGVEKTTFSAEVNSLADIHAVHMPFSHSLAFTLAWASLAWLIAAKVLHQPRWGLPLFCGVISHVVLDVMTHAKDIEIVPFSGLPALGTGLNNIPIAAFALEMAYCIFCWLIIKGSKTMLAVFLFLTISSATFYFPHIAGPEQLFATHPNLFAPFLGVHIIFASWVIWYGWKREQTASC